MTTTSKLILADLNGAATKYYSVEPITAPPASVVTKTPSHHVIVVDRSGSMYSAMDGMRTMIEKLCTLAEFKDPNQRISLISYSSMGDVRLHFARVTVADVMAPASAYLKEIRSLNSTGLTCISQALKLAATPVQPNETTVVSLHSDGYANHLSPGAEARAISEALTALELMPNVVVNTIAYSPYSDFSMLDGIANRGGGVCVRAQSLSQVYEALYATQTLLAGSVAPAVEFPLQGADYVVAYSRKAGKILGGNENVSLRGLPADADITGFRIRAVTPDAFTALRVPMATPDTVCAFARVLLARGDAVSAKYALSGAGLRTLLTSHYRALTGSDLGEFAEALDMAVFHGTNTAIDRPGLGFSGPTVYGILAAFARARDGVLINLPELRSSYRRRGVKRVAGTRNPDGSVTAPSTKLMTKDDVWVHPGNITFNNTEATVQLQIQLPAVLVDTATNTPISEVAGVKLNKLKSFANYTIISDGAVNTPTLRVRVVKKGLHETLVGMGVDLGKFDPAREYTLDLGKMAVIDFGGIQVSGVAEAFAKLSRLAVTQKLAKGLVDASVVAGGGEYSAEQVAALGAVNITPAGYYSAPTTTPYTDLDAALNSGAIDYRTAYQVVFGSTKLLHLKDFYSANEYLKRRFTATVVKDGATVDVGTPKMETVLDPTATWGVKKLSARTQLNSVDDVMFPLFQELLGITKPSAEIDGIRKAPESALAKIEDEIERVYADTLRPLVAYVSSTGIVPPQLGFVAMTPDEVKTKYGLAPGKAEADGTFYVHGDVTMIVYPQLKPFSTTPVTADDEG